MALTQSSEGGLKISNAGTNGQYLQKQSGNTGGLTWADVPAGVGGATGADFNDDVKIRLGTGNDLELYHSGSQANIRAATGQGSLWITGDQIELINGAVSETMLKAVSNAQVELYYDNSKKFETHSNGCIFTGDLYGLDTAKIRLGNSNDFEIRHDGNHSSLIDTGPGWLQLLGEKVKLANSDGSETFLQVERDGGVELYHNNVKTFVTTSTGIDIFGPEGGDANCHLIADEGDDNADWWKLKAQADGLLRIQNYTAGSWETNIECAGNGAVKLDYDNSTKLETVSGGVKFNDNTYLLDNKSAHFGTDNDMYFYHDGTNSHWVSQTGHIYIHNDNTAKGIAFLADEYWLNNEANTENMIHAVHDGAVSLYADNVKKLQTNSSYGTILSNTTDDANYTNVLTLARRGYEASGYGVNFKAKGGSSSGQNGLKVQVSQGSGGYSDKFTFDNDGLKFGSDTAAGNALNDYEEGTWTPKIYKNGTENSTHDARSGHYLKIGDLVWLTFYWYEGTGSNNQGSSGWWDVGNLPFNFLLINNGSYQSINIGYHYNSSDSGTQTGNERLQSNAAGYLRMYGPNNADAWNSGAYELSGYGVLRTT